ncbi:hypothetical protein [Streptomyces sp. NPDC102462]|uniref:hypothetical protein n=1 Tax=Streptomyces sp. NPDC102462 TaxID=3366178 RepID=UPI0037F537A6
MVPDGTARRHAPPDTVPLGKPDPPDTTITNASAADPDTQHHAADPDIQHHTADPDIRHHAADADADTQRPTADGDAPTGAPADGDGHGSARDATGPPDGAQSDDGAPVPRTDVPDATETDPVRDVGTTHAGHADTGTAHTAEDTDGDPGVRAPAAVGTDAVPETGTRTADSGADTGTDSAEAATPAAADKAGPVATGPVPHAPTDTHAHRHNHRHRHRRTTDAGASYAIAHPHTDSHPLHDDHHDVVHVPGRRVRCSADGRRPDGR